MEAPVCDWTDRNTWARVELWASIVSWPLAYVILGGVGGVCSNVAGVGGGGASTGVGAAAAFFEWCAWELPLGGREAGVAAGAVACAEIWPAQKHANPSVAAKPNFLPRNTIGIGRFLSAMVSAVLCHSKPSKAVCCRLPGAA